MTTADERKRAKETRDAELLTEVRRTRARLCALFYDYLARKGMVPADQRDTLVEALRDTSGSRPQKVGTKVGPRLF